jgi:hypothetical protein
MANKVGRYGISSFVYRARKPFHPKRLFDLVYDKFILLQNTEQHEDGDDDEEEEDNDNDEEMVDVDDEKNPEDAEWESEVEDELADKEYDKEIPTDVSFKNNNHFQVNT